MRLLLASCLVVSGLAAIAACSSSDSSSPTPADDSGTSPDGASADAASADAASDEAASETGADAGVVDQTEMEPNNGQPETAVNAMKLPGAMHGTIDPVNDIDIFAIELTPGDFWEWNAVPTGTDLAPHITIFDISKDALNPTVIGAAGAGKTALLQHFVLRPGTFVMAMRDARNVGTSQNKGGPTYGYTTTGLKKAPAPTPLTFPSTKTGKLAALGAVDLYTFTGTGGKGWDIVINADRKAPRSTLDSRISLFDVTAKEAIITNDNASASTTDSQIGSDDPFPSTYILVVENEGADATDLSYEIKLTQRP